MERHPGHNAGIVRGRQDIAIVADGPLVVIALVGLETGPLDRQPVMGQAKSGQPAEILGVPGREPVSLSRRRSVTGSFPIPPVRRGSSAFTLGGRSTRAPQEPFRPTHAHEYGKKAARPPRASTNGRGQRASCTEGDGGKALRDPLVSRVVGVEIVGEVAGIGRAEQIKPAHVVETVVPEAAPHLHNRRDRRAHLAHR